MKNFKLIIAVAVAVAGLLAVPFASAAQSAGRPNILFICTDQQHPAIAGYRGNAVVRTPNLDALAADGMHFTRSYVQSPVCGPSRASFMYGKYVYQIESWYNGKAWPEDEVTFAKRVTDSGYHTAHFGKMDSPGLVGKLGFTEEWHSCKRGQGVPRGLIRDSCRTDHVAPEVTLRSRRSISRAIKARSTRSGRTSRMAWIVHQRTGP
jgi:hypothetical protein